MAPELNVTGVVNADVSRNVPVISLASGRVVEIRAKLGDTVTKGQLLMRVQSADISGAFSDYRQAVADEVLAHAQLDRAQLLFDKGAIAQKELEVAQDAEDKAKVDVETAQEHLRVLGADMDHPTAVVDITAPVSGVIIEQNVTTAAGVKTLDNSPNLFTISDLSSVWIICDVYENDLANVHLGEYADIRLNAYPDRVFKGRIDNIGPILDPNIRTAKVRLEVQNPGMMRLGMFVTATFHGQNKQVRAVVPAAAVLHLHDRDWVYVPAGDNTFRRVEVVGGDMVPPESAGSVSGIKPGDAWWPTRWCCRIRRSSRSHDRGLVDFALEQSFPGHPGGAPAADLGRHFLSQSAGRSLSRRGQQLRPGDHAVARPRRRRSGAAGHHPARNRDERHPAPGASALHFAVRPLQPDADLRRRIRQRLEPPEGAGAALAGQPAERLAAADRLRLQPGRPDLLVHAARAPTRSTT